MSPSSTSSSDAGQDLSAIWRRIRRDVLWLVVILLIFDGIFRLPPIRDYLDPYENLLWYEKLMPAYQADLGRDPDYAMWLAGSSYMMTALNPQQMQERIRAAGYDDFTVQNFGMNWMVDLAVMARVYGHWMLAMDQPQYVVLAVSQNNLLTRGQPLILSSPIENVFVLQDRVEDYIGAFLYTHSALFRYGILLRNATFVPREQTALPDYPAGGYIHTDAVYDCDPDFVWDQPVPSPPERLHGMDNGLRRLDAFTDAIQGRAIPVIIVNLPLPACYLSPQYGALEPYNTFYLERLRAHLEAREVPFFDLNAPFQASIPPREQQNYFYDPRHPNAAGAALLGAWTADYFVAWVNGQDE